MTGGAPASRGSAAVWDEVKRLSGSTRRLRAIVDDMQLLSLAEATAVVKSGTLAALARSAQREIEEVFTKATGRKIALTIQGGDPAQRAGSAPAPAEQPPGASADSAAPAEQPPGTGAAPADARQHPLVKKTEELLGGRVVRVEARGRTV